MTLASLDAASVGAHVLAPSTMGDDVRENGLLELGGVTQRSAPFGVSTARTKARRSNSGRKTTRHGNLSLTPPVYQFVFESHTWPPTATTVEMTP